MIASGFRVRATGLAFAFKSASLVLKQVPTSTFSSFLLLESNGGKKTNREHFIATKWITRRVKAFKKRVVKFFWCNLHHRLEKYFKERFKEQLRIFLEINKYRPHNISQIRFFQWAAAFDNLCNRIGSQYLQLPNGVPTHVFLSSAVWSYTRVFKNHK